MLSKIPNYILISNGRVEGRIWFLNILYVITLFDLEQLNMKKRESRLTWLWENKNKNIYLLFTVYKNKFKI